MEWFLPMDDLIMFSNFKMMRPERDIDDYISKCSEKINFHKNQTIQCRSWNNAINLLTVSLASIQAFLMTVLPLLGASVLDLALTSGLFSMTIIISSKIRDNYQFLALSFQHENIENELINLHYDLVALKNDIEELSTTKYNKAISVYSNILIRSHIQVVSDCRSIFCCLKKAKDELL